MFRPPPYSSLPYNPSKKSSELPQSQIQQPYSSGNPNPPSAPQPPLYSNMPPLSSYRPKPSFLHHNETFIHTGQDGGKKLFPNPQTEIQNVLKNSNEKEKGEFFTQIPRSLATQDIPGGQVGTLQSKVVRNKEIAKKLIEENQSKKVNKKKIEISKE